MSWSFDVLVDAGCRPIVVAVPSGLAATARSLLGRAEHAVIVTGGATRQDSVAAALERVDSARVVVHDAARPFATVDLVTRVTQALDDADAVIAAIPLDDTIKSVSGGRVVETVDRSMLWRAQTPQAFDTEKLRRAHELARADGFVSTDDAQLVERYGGIVAIVEGTRENIKVTHPSDFAVAESIVRLRA